ncbi:MAG: DUF1963 domain-containing protein [Deltaproteobacteria bacterium]|nr:DUF1963 domain-containing protein [Deltaproteobacteria bacterium]
MVTDAELRAGLEAAGFGALVEDVIAKTRSEVWITATRSDVLALGQSRIGGAPDLPRGTPWPRQRWTHAETAAWPDWARSEIAPAIAEGVVIDAGTHLALALPFVAQLDCAELAPFQDVLPRVGHLWLFADQQTTLGEIGHHWYQASACLYAVDAELVPTPFPPVPEKLPGFVLAFALGRVLPGANDLDLRGDDWYRYEAAVEPFKQPEPAHALLPVSIAGANSESPPPGYTGILRVDSDYTNYTIDEGINWGDASWITFALPPAALAASRFDELRAFRFDG